MFSYRSIKNDYKSNQAKLHFYPSSMTSLALEDDISYKLLYARREGVMTNGSIKIDDILNAIPGI